MVRERKEGAEVAEGGQTVQADPFVPGQADDPEGLVLAHRRTALRLLREGNSHQAFVELVKASRAVPMTRSLSSALVRVSLHAGTEPACITLLTAGIEDTEGYTRVQVRRQLARLLRRIGAMDRAREELTYLLAEKSGDRRARRVLNAILLQEERWEELDASLEREVKDAVKRLAIGSAARASLQRARLWSERLKDHGRAAIRYAQSAQFFQQLHDHEAAFNLRLLWLRSLRESAAPAATLKDAVQLCLVSGQRVHKEARARSMIQEMGLQSLDPDPASTQVLDALGETARRGAQAELLAAAEEQEARGSRPESAALLTAAVNELPDAALEQRLESHHIARGAWRELAQFYRDRVARTSDASRKLEILTRLAEVLEDELNDPASAARAYGQIVELNGDPQALQEQVRLFSMVESVSGVRRALNDAVDRAPDDQAKAIALVARGDVHLHRHDLNLARADYEAALSLGADNLVARVGLAETRLQLGEAPSLPELQEHLKAMAKRSAGRLDLLRRFGRLADRHLPDQPAAKWAWSEVLDESPSDPEAQKRAAAVARKTKDVPMLERALRAQLTRDPRGTRARLARAELVTLLHQSGRRDDAQSELSTAQKVDPAHRVAWDKLSNALRAEAARLERMVTSPGMPFVPEKTAPGEKTGPAIDKWDLAIGQLPGGPGKDDEASAELERLQERIREDPLDADGYRSLHSTHAIRGEADRAALMEEISVALDGSPYPELPPTPSLMLLAGDRHALRPAVLRTDQAELLGLVGYSLCRLFPVRGRAAGSDRELAIDAGPGAALAVESLVSAVQILGLRAPEVFLAEDNGPPFSLVFTKAPRLLVGQLAVRSRIPAAELRFYAGRALFTQNPDLAALRTLQPDQLAQGMKLLEAALNGAGQLRPEARSLRDSLGEAALPRVRDLFERCGHQVDGTPLAEGARHAANRAGLLVCGAIGPAISALRAKKAQESEIAELVRFAASERYLELRTRSKAMAAAQ